MITPPDLFDLLKNLKVPNAVESLQMETELKLEATFLIIKRLHPAKWWSNNEKTAKWIDCQIHERKQTFGDNFSLQT